GQRLRIEGDFYFHLSARALPDRLRRVFYHRRLEDLRRRRFTTLLSYLVYYPCFWWLERHRDLHPIHAAGVQLRLGDTTGVVVLAGLGGMGKSTLVSALGVEPDASFLSVSFLLHCRNIVRPVPEPLLLDQWSRAWAGADALLTEVAHRFCLGREGFHWRADRRG